MSDRIANSPLAAGLLVAVLTTIVVLAARYASFLQPLELGVYDTFVRWRASKPSSPSPLAIVEVSEEDIRALGTWPMSDEVLAEALTALTELAPRVIGLDVYRDLDVPPGQPDLDEVLSHNDKIVAVYKFESDSGTGISAPRALRESSRTGFNDVLVDPGGVVRRGLLFMSTERSSDVSGTAPQIGYAFALQLALRYLRADGILPAPDPSNRQHLRLGGTTIMPLERFHGSYTRMDAAGYQYMLDYRSGLSSIPVYPLRDLLAGRIEAGDIHDKVVLIGTTAESVPDLFYTPFSPERKSAQQSSGVVLHALMTDQLIRFGHGVARPLRVLPDAIEILWTLLWSVVGAFAVLRIRSSWRVCLIGAAGVGVLVGTSYFAFTRDVWIPVVPPVLTWLGCGAVFTAYLANAEARDRRLLMNLFSRMVDPALAESIWGQRDRLLKSGRPSSTRLFATVMFTDLKGFTDISERLSPGDLMEWLNDYMEAMTPIVMAHEGVVLRFMGDAIMAAFGVPLARTSESEIVRDAGNAVRCALAMKARLIDFNREMDAAGKAMVSMRIGIFTGPMIGGTTGDNRRIEYCVQGDSVNTAARLETYDKESFAGDFLKDPCRILIGESTLRLLGDCFDVVEVGAVTLKGKTQTVRAYRVVGGRDSGTPSRLVANLTSPARSVGQD